MAGVGNSRGEPTLNRASAPAILLLLGLLISRLVSPAQVRDGIVRLAGCDDAPMCQSTWSFRKNVHEVYFLFTASLHGKFIRDLGASDIKVSDDRKPPDQILGFYTQRELPLRLGTLVDTSGSVSSQFEFEQASAGAFLAHVVRPEQDLAFVMGFSDIPEVKQDFTNNAGRLWRGVATLSDEERSTALFDAIIEGCRTLAAHPEDQFVARTLVVLSDGDDNSSRATLQDAIRNAQSSDVTIYAISAPGPFASDVGNQNLKKLAEQTGGRILYSGSADDLRSVFALLLEELHSRYAIAYRPAQFNLNGQYRRIEIKAEKSGKKLKIHGRRGYYAGIRTNVPDEAFHQITRLDTP